MSPPAMIFLTTVSSKARAVTDLAGSRSTQAATHYGRLRRLHQGGTADGTHHHRHDRGSNPIDELDADLPLLTPHGSAPAQITR